MRVLKNTLVFVMGLIFGIVLFAVALGGAIFALAEFVEVRQIQEWVGIEVVEDDAPILDNTLLGLIKGVLEDVANIDKLTLNDLMKKYGISLPLSISGIDISMLYDYPLPEAINRLDKVLEKITLRTLEDLIGLMFEDYGIPILTDNLDNNISQALDNLLKSINGDNMSIALLQENFGISLGEAQMLESVRYAPISAFGAILENSELGSVMEIDEDIFLPLGTNALWVRTPDNYVAVEEGAYSSITTGAKTYYSGIDAEGRLITRELRFVKKETTNSAGVTSVRFVPDYTSNAAGFTPSADAPVTYYKLIEYVPYTGAAAQADSELFVKAYHNSFVDSAGSYVLKSAGFFSLSTLYTSAAGDTQLRPTGTSTTINITSALFRADGEGLFAPAEAYGRNPEILPYSDSRLEQGFDGYIRVHKGTADAAMQSVSHITVKNAQNSSDKLMSMKLGELITIDDTSAAILKTLKDTPINKLSERFDSVTLADVTEIKMSAYTASADGAYVFVPEYGYVLASETTPLALDRYRLEYAENPTGKYVDLNGIKYLYNDKDARFNNLQRHDKVFVLDNTSGNYVRQAMGGHYSLWTPGVEGDRFDRIYDSATDSSLALQRLANASVNGFAAEFKNLVLGDAMNIEVDVFTVAAVGQSQLSLLETGTDYFYYDGEIFMPADVFGSSFWTGREGETIYKIKTAGSGNPILKRLAYITIDAMPTRITSVINSTRLTELIEITLNDRVRAYQEGDAEARWLIGANPYFTEIENGEIVYYTFVYDEKGKYYMTDELYKDAAASQLIKDGTISYSYTKITSNEIYLQKLAAHNVFVKAGNTGTEEDFVYNIAYAASRKAKAASIEDAGLYFRDTAGSDYSMDTYRNTQGSTGSGLYIKVLGAYVRYDAANAAHAGQDLYFKYAGGFIGKSADAALNTATLYYFDSATGEYVQTATATCGAFVYVSMPAYPSGSHYFSRVDKSMTGIVTYSKVRCSVVYMENAAGAYVYNGKTYEAYDPENEAHALLTRCDKTISYVAKEAEVYTYSGGSADQSSALSNVKVSLLSEKSSAIMLSLDKKKSTVGSLDGDIINLSLQDLIDIEPGSMFDQPALKTTKLSNLSSSIGNMLQSMTITQLLDWGNVGNVRPEVREILSEVTLTDFFASLEFDIESGMLYVNMDKLFA